MKTLTLNEYVHNCKKQKAKKQFLQNLATNLKASGIFSVDGKLNLEPTQTIRAIAAIIKSLPPIIKNRVELSKKKDQIKINKAISIAFTTTKRHKK